MKTLFKCWFLICISLMLNGCNKNQTVGVALPKKKLTLNLQEGDPPSLNPYVGVDLRSRCLFLNLYEPLMRKQASGELACAAAEKVEVDPTKTVYTFHIRPHLWSNGEQVTSYHFEKAWKYALTPLSHCIRSDLFYAIKNGEKVKKGELPLEALGIATPDAKTLIVTLEHPIAYFLDLTATSFFTPLYHASDLEPTCFNGPFKVKERVHDERLVLERNSLYWDAKTVEVDEVCFTMVRDPMTALAMYEKKELDLVGDPFSSLPFDVIPDLRKADALKTESISRIFYLLVNTETYPFNVKPLRKALALSLDRKELTDHLFFGEIPTLSSVPQTLSLLGEEEFTYEEEDPRLYFEEALREMNITKEEFPTITLSYAELSGQKKLAEFISEQWKKKLGIEIKTECNEWNLHIAKIRKGNYQIGTFHLTTLFPDPMFYFDLFRDKKSLSNYCRWEKESFRQLLEKIETTIDPLVRRNYLCEAEREMFEEMPVIPLFTQNLQYLMQDHVNLEITNLGIYDFKGAKVR